MLMRKVVTEPRSTETKIKMIKGSLKLNRIKLTLTLCILAKEILATNRMVIKSRI